MDLPATLVNNPFSQWYGAVYLKEAWSRLVKISPRLLLPSSFNGKSFIVSQCRKHSSHSSNSSGTQKVCLGFL